MSTLTPTRLHESIDPSTGEVIGSYVSAGRAEAEAAIAAARTAFDTTGWSRDPSRRSRALHELADRLAERTPAIARMLARENGKLLAQTMWELHTAVEWLRYSAASALVHIAGRAAEPAPGSYYHSAPEAAGVAGIIVPWNSPVVLLVRALGPALGAGCTTVVKMPGQTALTNALFAEAVAATPSLPAGVVTILTEAGNEVAPLLVTSPDVDVISYTGSTRVGRAIAAEAAPTLKRLGLELGGKTPLIVFDDADLDTVVPTLVASSILMNGEFCCTGSRILAQRGIAGELRGRLAAALEKVKVGPALDPTSDLGPLIDKAGVARVDRLVEEAAAYGEIIVRGGPVTDPDLAGGAFFRPALIEVDRVDVPLVQEEIFGPVQTFEVFADDTEAIRRANATEFGLAASVFTRDDLRARRVARELRFGGVWFNTWGSMSEHFEQGGMKQSGYGTLCGPSAMSEFQYLKTYGSMAPRPA
ncbi:aldehyde dehydrogenase family protein [Pseudosporangium ferrugineum]|uniref:Acyl-CoA reductase-like NAD-dependent aldehyde dehydrogenase n=1 Tax=Pseudosporangium ferrugineum TaxID=439699 RepID=A0A2T0S4Q8_9ACTN|nr:aldehyde dehydrogenase family protein [Pseudosporangium ferrugineum]PRY28283.1 acyl-CoA reductase-like NAD-dependent aldehyde dehydrogenase [Pseudosporangium ferrugineum]